MEFPETEELSRILTGNDLKLREDELLDFYI